MNLEGPFWAKAIKFDEPGRCWPWTGRKDEHGRGRWQRDGRSISAPRYALILAQGPPESEDLEACHRCDNPSCVRPEHLFWGTKSDNMRDMALKGRSGMQRHPEKYRRPRRPDVPYRPVKQPNPPKGIDARTWTRKATPEERLIAHEAFERLILLPKDNPEWYREFARDRRYQVKRCRVLRALKRVWTAGRVRGNGYEREVLEFMRSPAAEGRQVSE